MQRKTAVKRVSRHLKNVVLTDVLRNFPVYYGGVSSIVRKPACCVGVSSGHHSDDDVGQATQKPACYGGGRNNITTTVCYGCLRYTMKSWPVVVYVIPRHHEKILKEMIHDFITLQERCVVVDLRYLWMIQSW